MTFNTDNVVPCPRCGTGTMIEVYPAMFHPIGNTSAGEQIVSAEEAACFYHPQKKASIPCDSCGRFLCALCDVELNGQHICPNCLQSGKKKGRIKNLENERTLYDHIALMLSLLPMVLFFITIITAPIALFLSIRHWKSPTSIVPRHSRMRFVIAIILSLSQIVFWIVVLTLQFNRHR